MGSRCLWDQDTDVVASESLLTVSAQNFAKSHSMTSRRTQCLELPLHLVSTCIRHSLQQTVISGRPVDSPGAAQNRRICTNSNLFQPPISSTHKSYSRMQNQKPLHHFCRGTTAPISTSAWPPAVGCNGVRWSDRSVSDNSASPSELSPSQSSTSWVPSTRCMRAARLCRLMRLNTATQPHTADTAHRHRR